MRTSILIIRTHARPLLALPASFLVALFVSQSLSGAGEKPLPKFDYRRKPTRQLLTECARRGADSLEPPYTAAWLLSDFEQWGGYTRRVRRWLYYCRENYADIALTNLIQLKRAWETKLAGFSTEKERQDWRREWLRTTQYHFLKGQLAGLRPVLRKNLPLETGGEIYEKLRQRMTEIIAAETGSEDRDFTRALALRRDISNLEMKLLSARTYIENSILYFEGMGQGNRPPQSAYQELTACYREKLRTKAFIPVSLLPVDIPVEVFTRQFETIWNAGRLDRPAELEKKAAECPSKNSLP